MRFLHVAFISLFPIAACAPTVQVTSAPIPLNTAVVTAAHTAAAHDLYDPNSAQFREDATYRLSNGDTAICGQMNAKNQLGGYIGFMPYYVRATVALGQITIKAKSLDLQASAGCTGLAAGSIGIDAATSGLAK